MAINVSRLWSVLRPTWTLVEHCAALEEGGGVSVVAGPVVGGGKGGPGARWGNKGYSENKIIGK